MDTVLLMLYGWCLITSVVALVLAIVCGIAGDDELAAKLLLVSMMSVIMAVALRPDPRR